MMDNYTRIVLTVIAACLLAITFKLYEPSKAIAEEKKEGRSASEFLGIVESKNSEQAKSIETIKIGPTVGELATFMECKSEECKQELTKILRRVPLVKEIDM